MNRYAMPNGRRRCVAALLMTMAGGHGNAGEVSRPFNISNEYASGDRFMQIRLRGTLRLMPEATDGLVLHELSGLAWSSDEAMLYAISDAGFVAHLRPRFDDGVLVRVALDAVYPLRGPDGAPVTKRLADAEGLVARRARNGVRGDTELIVSFESMPRIVHYTTRGEYLHEAALPPALSKPRRFATRNHALEALTDHDEFGLITGPERPLKKANRATIPLYSLAGQSWLYAPVDPDHSALVGLETMPNGDLLVLERRYASVFRPVIVSLRRMQLSRTQLPQAAPVTDIARFYTSRGWSLDNFEGVARHEGSCYFIVSDDNASAIQNTLLMYFEIREEAAPDQEIGCSP